MPISRAARSTRTAISPRLAMRILRNMRGVRLRLLDLEEPLPELDRAPRLDQTLHDRARELGFNLVHQLHRLDDAQRLAGTNVAAHVDECGCLGRRSSVERAHERRRDV